MRATAICVAVITVLLSGLAYLEFSPDQKSFPRSLPPFLSAVSTCMLPMPGMKRIGGQTRFDGVFSFDVPTSDFTIREDCTDAPPLICGVGIKPKNSGAYLNISWGEETIDRRPPDPILDPSNLDLSAFVEKRRVLDSSGKMIGQESWGYWGQDELWRRVHLLGGVQVRYGARNESEVRNYGSTHERDAALFDRIINSACRVSSADE